MTFGPRTTSSPTSPAEQDPAAIVDDEAFGVIERPADGAGFQVELTRLEDRDALAFGEAEHDGDLDARQEGAQVGDVACRKVRAGIGDEADRRQPIAPARTDLDQRIGKVGSRWKDGDAPVGELADDAGDAFERAAEGKGRAGLAARRNW
ncbi:MAG: hypothetical protein R3D02_10620 [Hyphomicrobiales bacterium]